MEQKVLLCCAGGASTGLLMKKMEKYWEELGIDLKIKATSVSTCENISAQFDVILIGPQTRYMLEEIKRKAGKPAEVIPSVVYGMQKCDEIKKLVDKLYTELKGE